MTRTIFRRFAGLLAAGAALWPTTATALVPPLAPGTSARYKPMGPDERSKLLVDDVRVTVLGGVDHAGEQYCDWQMDVVLTDGKKLGVRATSRSAPMTCQSGCGPFLRYQVRLPCGDKLDYRDERTGLAVLPQIAFESLFLPVPEDESVMIDGFAGAGRYLAHVLLLDHVTRDFTTDRIEGATVLNLRPDLLIGTSRSFRDDGKGLNETTKNYTYVKFEKKDYDEMIAAGANYFGVSGEQGQCVINRPVFYRGAATFPDDYYRSNYAGRGMYSDEPMSRLANKREPPADLAHPQQMASYLQSRIRQIYSQMSPLEPIAAALEPFKIQLDGTVTGYKAAPTWETEYQASFYVLAGGSPGVVHEGRYAHRGWGWAPDGLFGAGLEVSPREMMLCYYAFMRGAARAFNGDWGTSIYGQADPAMRVEALTLAYDLGAKYLWFWTSDRFHHVLYTDQLKLTRAVVEHAAAHPRAPLAELRRAAKVGVVFPAGYTLSWGQMWGVRSFSFESRNRADTPYREVVAAAMWEGVLCAKRGIPFDFTVEHEGLAGLGYEQLMMIGEDAGVQPVPNRLTADPSHPVIRASVGETEELKSPEPPVDPIRSMPVFGRPITIDGDLEEWKDAQWVAQRDKPSGEGSWDGPKDLATRIAFAHDGTYLYVAAVVDDDRQSQPYYGWDMWKGDCLQIGFDPLNEQGKLAYSGNQNEIGFALLDGGRPVAWRWHCRRGQKPREMSGVPLAIKRLEAKGQTVYEAALPLAELTPLCPALTPTVGVGVTFNDADEKDRETFHETSPGAMSHGKNSSLFRKLTLPDTTVDARTKIVAPRDWAAFLWVRTVAPEGGTFQVDCLSRSWDSGELEVDARLEACQPNSALTALSSVSMPSTDQAMRRRISVTADAPPGRYRLSVAVKNKSGAVVASEGMTVFVFPKSESTGEGK